MMIVERPAREETDQIENPKVTPDVYLLERNISFIHGSPAKNSIMGDKECEEKGSEGARVTDSEEEKMQQQ